MAVNIGKDKTVTVANALHSAAIHLLRRLRKEDERSGIGPARLSVLSVLVFGGPMRLSDIARIEQVRPPTMTKLIAALERDGLTKRRPDGTDARAFHVQATRRGTTLLHQGRKRRIVQLAAALKSVPTTELNTLARAAEIIERVVPKI